MLGLTEFSTASKRLNLNNPIQGTRGRDRMGATSDFRSVGSANPLLPSVPKGRDNENGWQKSVILYTRAIIIIRYL